MPQSSNPNWKPPDRLGYSSSRAVCLSGQGTAIVVVIALLFVGGFVLGIFLANKNRRETQEHRLLDEQGVNVDAVITRLWRTGDKSDQPRVSYRFEYQGSVFSTSVNAPDRLWRGLKVGEPLAVRFVPSRPTISHPTDWRWRGMPFWLPYFLTAMLAGVGALLATQLARQMRLLAEGRPAPGRVTGIRKDKATTVLYEFDLPNGTKQKGRSHTRKVPPSGEPVCVLYDPENPKRNALYPLDLVRLDLS
jgi:hypothetical protein